MKRLLPTFVILLAFASIAWAQPPALLTSLYAITALSNAEASKQLPVAFEATVNYYLPNSEGLDVQEDGQGIYVKTTKAAGLVPGDRVLVQGTTQPSFRPYILADKVTFLRHGKPPEPMPATFDDLVRTTYMCRLVRVRGVVRAADPVSIQMLAGTRLQLLMDGGYVDAEVESRDAGAIKDLLDAEVEVTGIGGRQFDSKMQQTGVVIRVSTFANIKILKRAGASPWSLPVMPMDEIITGIHVRDLSQRLRVHGTITYYQPGSAVVLQSGAKSLWVSTQTDEPLRIGDVADAIGFPDSRNHQLTLTHAEIHDSHVQAPVSPQPATWHQLAFWERNQPNGHVYDLVSIEGQVVTEVREAAQDEYVLVADKQLFTAVYRHPPSPLPLPSMLEVPLGSKVRVTGICMMADFYPVNNEVSFDILMRSFDDIEVVARPSLLNIRNLILLAGLLLSVVIIVGIRGWAIERKVRRQTAALAALEQRRGRILEDINGSRPLAEILEEIAAMVSATLGGAPCWCVAGDGERQGAYPQEPHTLRIVQAEIPSRSGPPLGTIYAALHSQAHPSTREAEALQNGARLATLAIETRKLYSDLCRRSEFDLLTDIPNRFAMEKFMELQIEEARHSGRFLGLIYIDLDKFKPINDTYGHHVGDLYLQAVALRMSRQLLGGDMLARLGGDEFAAMVLLHHGRSDVEKIVARLESCFNEPFSVEGIILHGEASIGVALFPEDGATKDSLLSAADTAMYAAKNAKRQIEKSLPRNLHTELTAEVRA
ncbi:MAG: GGDEF domain-containing protein [Terracidiphilus sp.]